MDKKEMTNKKLYELKAIFDSVNDLIPNTEKTLTEIAELLTELTFLKEERRKDNLND